MKRNYAYNPKTYQSPSYFFKVTFYQKKNCDFFSHLQPLDQKCPGVVVPISQLNHSSNLHLHPLLLKVYQIIKSLVIMIHRSTPIICKCIPDNILPETLDSYAAKIHFALQIHLRIFILCFRDLALLLLKSLITAR